MWHSRTYIMIARVNPLISENGRSYSSPLNTASSVHSKKTTSTSPLFGLALIIIGAVVLRSFLKP